MNPRWGSWTDPSAWAFAGFVTGTVANLDKTPTRYVLDSRVGGAGLGLAATAGVRAEEAPRPPRPTAAGAGTGIQPGKPRAGNSCRSLGR